MMIKAALVTAALAVVAKAQDYNYIPEDFLGGFCDGKIRPDWQECEDNFLNWIQSTELQIGPSNLDGTIFRGEKCTLRYVKCGDQEGGWVQEDEMGMFQDAMNFCQPVGGRDVGAVKRSGNLCLIIEDPTNRFIPNLLGSTRSVEERGLTRSHPRDLAVPENKPRDAAKSLARRDGECPSDGPCYKYAQKTWAVSVRGLERKVCDNILPKGATCTSTKSVTITDTWTGSVDITAGIKDVVDVAVGFTTSYSEAVTESLATAITVDCENSGYVVWYPLEEVSSGSLSEGTCNGEFCQNLGLPTNLRVTKPIVNSETGGLSGEYAVRCI